jgi:hypothetical protein
MLQLFFLVLDKCNVNGNEPNFKLNWASNVLRNLPISRFYKSKNSFLGPHRRPIKPPKQTKNQN